MSLRFYQIEARKRIEEAWAQGHKNVMLVLPTGAGKCLGKGTPILMFDGVIKNVEDVKTGDLLMGADSTPRKVLSTCVGSEMLYRVTPKKGDSYIVNESHILSLKQTGLKSMPLYPCQAGKGKVVNISVLDYLKSSKNFKHTHKGWRTGVTFSDKKEYSPILPPYLLGLWLGDGSTKSPAITTADVEIVNFLYDYSTLHDFRISITDHPNNASNTYTVCGKRGSGLTAQLKQVGVFGNKHIPLSYLTGSVEQRLDLLAGLIDSDGYLTHNGYDIVFKIEQLAKDTIYLARSLGFAAYITPCKKKCYNTGAIGDYFRISISGSPFKIPVKIARYQNLPRRQIKDVLVTGIRVEPIGIGEYYGFELDGDHLFLLGDFTVTHNTKTSADLIHAHTLSHIVALNKGATCVIAHRQELVSQLSMALNREGVRHKIIAPPKIIKACCRLHMKDIGKSYFDVSAQTAVAGVDTLIRRTSELKGWTSAVTLWVTDECFPAGTMIGMLPIQKIKIGDTVTAFNEKTKEFESKKVTRLFKNKAPEYMVRINIGHHVLYCTKNHPILTQKGWKNAECITQEDHVYMVRDKRGGLIKTPLSATRENWKSILLKRMFKFLSRKNFFGNYGSNKPKICFRKNDPEQPNVKEIFSRENESYFKSDETSTESKRGQWKASYRSGKNFILSFFRDGIYESSNCQNREKEGARWLSGALQNRLWESLTKNRDRSRRDESLQPKSERIRSTQRHIFEWKRVDDIKIQKRSDIRDPRGSCADGYVYNFEVEDLHTYTANGIVVHNCHHVLSPEINKWGKAIEMFPNAKGLGVTASPRRADGKGLGSHADGVFDTMIEGITMRELIDLGYLVDYRVFAPPSDLDLSSVAISKTTGDYNHDQIVNAVRKSHIVGDVVDHYLRIAKGKRGITFATDVQTAHDISDRFNQAGIPAKAVSADTPDTERYDAVQDLASGKLLQLVNVDLFGEGVDVPAVEVVSFARPTESLSLHIQQAGRALRLLLPRSDHEVWETLAPEERKRRISTSEKPHAIIIDHVGNIVRHGLPDARRAWSLDRRDSKKRTKDDDIIPARACPQCTMVYERIYKACPFCGFEPIPAGRSLPEQVDGDLMELDAETLARMRGDVDRANMSIEDKQLELAQKHVPYIGQLAQVKQHRSRLEMLSALKETMAVWGGVETARGRTDSEIQRLFYFKFGIDVLSAQGLPTKDAEELLIRIALEVNDVATTR